MLTGAAGAGGVGAAESAAVLAPGAHRQTQRQPVRWQQRQEADGGCLGGEEDTVWISVLFNSGVNGYSNSN